MKTSWKLPTPMVALATALAAREPAAAEKQTEAEVRAEFARWTEAYRQRDLPGTMRIFDPEVRFAFQGGPDAGYADLERGYAAEFKTTATAEWAGTIDEVQSSGDLAAEFSTWKLIKRKAGAEKVLAHNRGVDLFRRDAQGRWRLIRSLNYPVQPRAPAKG